MKPRLLDLYCGAGGATKGYQRAGFHVTGVDIKPQPRYCGDHFIQGDALEVLAELVSVSTLDQPPAWQFDAVHASPPCQAYTRAQVIRGREHPDLVAATRELLVASRLPYIIENVPGAPLHDPVLLCGSSLGRPFCRHRLFELSWQLGTLVPPCAKGQLRVAPEHELHTRKKGSVRGERLVRGIQIFGANARADVAREAMEMPWANRDEISEAIPPVYTEFIGEQLAHRLERVW